MLYPVDGSTDALVAYGRGATGATGDVSAAQLTAAIDALNDELYALILLRATIAGPVTYTGDHLFPTQAAANNSTKVATTAYVDQGDTNVLALTQPLDALLTAIAGLSPTVSGVPLFTAGAASALTLDTDTGLVANSDTRLATQKAVKTYVDGVSSGLSIKPTVIARTTANVSVSGGGIADGTTHDGVTVTTGQRILVASQSTPSQNGIYLVPASGAASRAPDMDSWIEVPGAFCFVEKGTLYADTAFVCTADDGGTLGTTAITWSQFAGPGTFAAGAGLSLTGTTFAISDVELLAIAGLTSAANKGITFTGLGTAATYDLTAFALTLLDDANQGAMQTTLGLVLGTNVQAFDADLSALAANSTDGFWAHTAAGTGAARTLTAPAAGLTISNPAGIAGNPTFALANDLSALEALSGTNTIYYRSAADTWTAVTIGALLSFSAGTLNITDAELAALAGLTSAADKLPYWTGSGTASNTDFTSAARSLLDDTTVAAMRTTLGLSFAGLTAHSATITSGGGTVTGATISQDINYLTIDKITFIQGNVTITNKGSGSPTGYVGLSLPVNANKLGFANGMTGSASAVVGFIGGGASRIEFFKYDASTLWADGTAIYFAGWYNNA